MATYNFPPADLTPTQADALVRGLCEELGLDYSKVKPALDAGSTVVRVALMGESGGWPEEHIRTARAEFGQRLPKTVDLGASADWPINKQVLIDIGRLLDDGVMLGLAQQRWVVAAANALSNALDDARENTLAWFTWDDDPAQPEPFMVCRKCGDKLCTIEEGDELDVIILVARDHRDVCTGAGS